VLLTAIQSNFLHFGHRQSSYMTPCGLLPVVSYPFVFSPLSFAHIFLLVAYLYCIHLILHIYIIASGLVEGQATEARFSFSLLSRAFSLAQPTR
jgi:hypothetical protein